jgi:hypothetical protein
MNVPITHNDAYRIRRHEAPFDIAPDSRASHPLRVLGDDRIDKIRGFYTHATQGAPVSPSFSVSRPIELRILTWKGLPRAIFIPRFGGWQPPFFIHPRRYPRGVTKSPWQHNGRGSTHRPPLLTRFPRLYCLFDGRTYNLWGQEHADQNFTLARYRAITFDAGDKSAVLRVRKYAMAIARERKGGAPVCLKTACRVLEAARSSL